MIISQFSPLILLVGSLSILVVTEIHGFSQGRARPASAERRVDHLKRQSEQYERDKLSGDIQRGGSTPSYRRPSAAVALRVKQDFENLQANYNEIVLAMTTKKPLDHDLILEAVEEIRKSSVRLKNDLALPQSEENKESQDSQKIDSDRFESALLTLREHIYSFVTNPLFESSGVLDVMHAEKASVDLDMIIELSENISRSNASSKRG